MEARGLYREMLTQAWRRGGRLPNDHEAIRRAVGATPREWRRGWPAVEKYWRIEGEWLMNDTQLEVYRAATSLQTTRRAVGRLGGLTTQAKRRANGQAKLNTPSPSPSPSFPPVVPQGGRFTKRELQHAEDIRSRAHGGCPHDPRCESFAVCVRLIAAERKSQAS
jgi:uncharacterized protein YdaU (DUF1376 family)